MAHFDWLVFSPILQYSCQQAETHGDWLYHVPAAYHSLCNCNLVYTTYARSLSAMLCINILDRQLDLILHQRAISESHDEDLQPQRFVHLALRIGHWCCSSFARLTSRCGTREPIETTNAKSHSYSSSIYPQSCSIYPNAETSSIYTHSCSVYPNAESEPAISQQQTLRCSR